MKYVVYDEYKSSHVDWLGDVPCHWVVKAIKWESPVLRGASPRPIDDPIYFDDDGEYAWVRISDVTEAGTYLENTEQKLSDVGSRLSVKLKSGDLFLSIAGSVGKPCITRIKCCIHDGFVYFPRWKADPKFLYYLFVSGEPYKGLGKMGTQLNLNTDTVGSIVIGLPDADEQQTIARFLDAKTAQIDELIAKKRQLIAKLKEKRQALIARAVTRGLPPEVLARHSRESGNPGGADWAPACAGATEVTMKDSGVDWLGAVPKAWQVKRLGFMCAKIGSGKTPSGGSETYEDSGIVFLRSQNVYDEGLELSDVAYINEGVDAEMKHSRVEGFDVLLNITGASIGRSCLVPKGFPAANVNQHVCIIRLADKSISEFVSWVLKAPFIKSQIDAVQSGAAREGLNFDQISKFLMALPGKDERNEICEYLERETDRIDSLIRRTEIAIARLTEYRQALITSAVTGKIDVRGFRPARAVMTGEGVA